MVFVISFINFIAANIIAIPLTLIFNKLNFKNVKINEVTKITKDIKIITCIVTASISVLIIVGKLLVLFGILFLVITNVIIYQLTKRKIRKINVVGEEVNDDTDVENLDVEVIGE